LQLKGEECVTIDRPPNHKLFDLNAPKLTPVLQHQLDAENAKNLKAPAVAAPALVINFTIRKDIVELFQLHMPAAARLEAVIRPEAPIPVTPT
jgi:hypothetical protein